MKRTLFALFCLATPGLLAREPLSLVSQPLTAGLVSLTDAGYVVSRTLGEAAFAPELALPVQLVYDSSLDQSGIFGYGWRSPQLESTVRPEPSGVVWTAPWGEKIRFTAKSGAGRDGFLARLAFKTKGRGYFAPYGDWEADTPADGKAAAASGNWTITGKLKYEGWTFTYRDARLLSIATPFRRTVAFSYGKDGLPAAVSTKDGRALLTLSSEGGRISGLTLNGVPHAFAYAGTTVQIPPKNPNAALQTVGRTSLASVKTGTLAPVTYTYDGLGYLVSTRQGDLSEALEVRHETPAERLAAVKTALDKKAAPPAGKLAGTLMSDSRFTYKHAERKGGVELTDRAGRTAFYDYDTQKGIFKTVDFSGKAQTVYYFMRYDVAYLGKIRQVVDGEGRVAASYRYDKKTGNVTRARDLAGNDVEYAYTPAGDLALVSRRAAGSDVSEPLVRVEYDARRNPAALSRLDGKGNAAVTTRLRNNAAGQPVSVDDGRASTEITYTHDGFPETVRDAFGLVTRIAYDEYNRRIETADPVGAKTRAAYDGNGLVKSVERTFDGRVLSSVAVAYNGNGLPVSYADHRGRTKAYERDAFGRVVKELFPDGTAVGYGFDPAGRLTRVLDQNGHALAFTWGRSGVEAKETAAGQRTEYTRDKAGRLARAASRFADAERPDRAVTYTYDRLDRLVAADYGDGQVETLTYDAWGRVAGAVSCGSEAAFKHDYFGRVIEKREGGTVETCAYDAWGLRTERVTRTPTGTLAEKREYDRYGRLIRIKTGTGTAEFAYDAKNRLARQTVNGTLIDYAYTPEGWLKSKTMRGADAASGRAAVSTLEYFYEQDGRIAGRAVDGKFQRYAYDAKDQLTAVFDAENKLLEAYVYDPAGNILKKTVGGVTTEYAYDGANQLVRSVEDGILQTRYRYDAAGRLAEESGKAYRYGWLDKVLEVTLNGERTAAFRYHAGGQLAEAEYKDKTETFLWDGLALIRRGKTEYLNEPHAGGGAPVLAGDTVLFNDLLGSTLGAKGADGFRPVARAAFGETAGDGITADEFFTGKPRVADLGYAFLLRNYRSEHGKWQTADPLGYPDGWNNLAYCNNDIMHAIDWLGAWHFVVIGSSYKSGVFTDGTHGNNGYNINYCVSRASQSASGDGTSQLTITCSGSFSFSDTAKGINVSISLSFSFVYTVDENGNVSSRMVGTPWDDDGDGTIIWGSGGGASALIIRGLFSNDTFSYQSAVQVAGISFKVVE
jgi:RHS repeat-associated protein